MALIDFHCVTFEQHTVNSFDGATGENYRRSTEGGIDYSDWRQEIPPRRRLALKFLGDQGSGFTLSFWDAGSSLSTRAPVVVDVEFGKISVRIGEELVTRNFWNESRSDLVSVSLETGPQGHVAVDVGIGLLDIDRDLGAVGPIKHIGLTASDVKAMWIMDGDGASWNGRDPRTPVTTTMYPSASVGPNDWLMNASAAASGLPKHSIIGRYLPIWGASLLHDLGGERYSLPATEVPGQIQFVELLSAHNRYGDSSDSQVERFLSVDGAERTQLVDPVLDIAPRGIGWRHTTSPATGMRWTPDEVNNLVVGVNGL